MKAVIVYFSLDGNTDYAAKRIAEQTGAELLRLKPVKDYPESKAIKMILGGKSAIFGEKPKLKPYEFSSADYDLIIIGSPVWAGRLAPPVKTFLSKNNISGSTVACFSCHAGEYPKKFFETMRIALKDCNIVSEADFTDPSTRRCDETDSQIDEFCRKLAIKKN